VPVRVTGLTDVTVIAGGLGAAYALRGDGTVWAWGMGGAGRLGNGSTESSSVPVQVSGLTDATAIAAGGGYYVTLLGGAAAHALRTDGTVMAWGTSQQLGNGATANSSVPVPVSGLAGVTVIAAGPFNGYAVTG
jgi:alpha-tubulin suppressor-like RCC1 family protein